MAIIEQMTGLFRAETLGLPLRVTRDLQFRKTVLEQVADITAERDALWQRLALLARPSRSTRPTNRPCKQLGARRRVLSRTAAHRIITSIQGPAPKW
ncbi:hypothetical protein [Bradyrhizobium paxllaeri]|uniref:hypothetical protein n=1 Tax=Bradyrhizobium paxllaeri TaxID=190148 RepID=UPI0008103FCA|nr:hypothetical protein [Bradyrhizobium paxllaeri]